MSLHCHTKVSEAHWARQVNFGFRILLSTAEVRIDTDPKNRRRALNASACSTVGYVALREVRKCLAMPVSGNDQPEWHYQILQQVAMGTPVCYNLDSFGLSNWYSYGDKLHGLHQFF